MSTLSQLPSTFPQPFLVLVRGMRHRCFSSRTLPFSGALLPGCASSGPSFLQERFVAKTPLMECHFWILRLDFRHNAMTNTQQLLAMVEARYQQSDSMPRSITASVVIFRQSPRLGITSDIPSPLERILIPIVIHLAQLKKTLRDQRASTNVKHPLKQGGLAKHPDLA